MENMENTMVVVADENNGFVADLTQTRTAQFCSMKAESQEEKALLFKAMNTPDARLSDCVNMTINVKDIYAEIVTLVSSETGEVTDCPRIVFVDDKGKSYQAVSRGIYNATKKLFAVYGLPTWTNPIPLMIKSISKGEKRILSFEIDTTKKSK